MLPRLELQELSTKHKKQLEDTQRANFMRPAQKKKKKRQKEQDTFWNRKNSVVRRWAGRGRTTKEYWARHCVTRDRIREVSGYCAVVSFLPVKTLQRKAFVLVSKTYFVWEGEWRAFFQRKNT